MSISSRIEATIEGWSQLWKDRLRGWMADVIGFGVEVFADVLAKSMAPKLKPIIDRLEATDKVPPELQPLLNEIKNPTGEAAAAFGLGASGPLVGGAIGRIADAVMLPISYSINSVTRNVILAPQLLFSAELRGTITKEKVNEYLGWLGYTQEDIEIWRDQFKPRFPSDVVLPAVLRDKDKFGKYLADVIANGVTPDRLELLKEMAYQIPGVRDVIRYAVKEAYNPAIYSAFGQDQEFPDAALPDAERAGARKDYLLKEWIAHWDLPSTGQGFDLLHRGEITEDELNKLLKALDVMPFWRDKLIALSWDLPNRVELRMMARYGLVNKEFLLTALKKIGLTEEYRSVVADMMIAVGVRTDLGARYSKGWIDAQGVQSELQATGLSPEIVTRVYQWIVSNVKPERIATEKNLTKAEIIKGVKLGVISYDEGIAQLMAMGYDPDEAMYIMAINVEVLSGSPDNLAEFKRLTDLYRLSQGQKTDRSPQEIRVAEKNLISKKFGKPPVSEEQVKVQTDTIRRKRRSGQITRDQEIAQLLEIGIDVKLATAYADNDDLRIRQGASQE